MEDEKHNLIMRSKILIFFFLTISISVQAQFENTFTEWQSWEQRQKNQNVTPQKSNLQIVSGVYLKNNQFYAIKLRVGVNEYTKQVYVDSYWDGRNWTNCYTIASTIGYNVPEQIRNACQYEAMIGLLGTVFF